jgi:hypothetical protein
MLKASKGRLSIAPQGHFSIVLGGSMSPIDMTSETLSIYPANERAYPPRLLAGFMALEQFPRHGFIQPVNELRLSM